MLRRIECFIFLFCVFRMMCLYVLPPFIHFSHLLQDFEKERDSPECSSRSPPLMLRPTSPSSPVPPCDRVNLSTSLMNSSLMGTGRVSPPDQQQHAVTAAAAVAAAAAAAQAHLNGTSEYNIVPQIFYCFQFSVLLRRSVC